jgi:uncharacterized protein (TIGR00255 family)
MIKSMTGFSKAEVSEGGIHATIEVKCLNGRYLDINCKMPRNVQHREYEVRDLIRRSITRGTLTLNITVESDAEVNQFGLNETAAKNIEKETENQTTGFYRTSSSFFTAFDCQR